MPGPLLGKGSLWFDSCKVNAKLQAFSFLGPSSKMGLWLVNIVWWRQSGRRTRQSGRRTPDISRKMRRHAWLKGRHGKRKVQCPNKNVDDCVASISHSAPQHTHTPSIRCYKGWGRTHKRMSNVNSIWNVYVELSMRNVELKKLNTIGFWNMGVDLWMTMKQECWIAMPHR